MIEACKEECDNALLVLRRNMNRLSDDDYDDLYTFLKKCRSRLPYRATIDRAREIKAERKSS